MTEAAAPKPGWNQLLRDPALLCAFGGGAGLSSKAPGTMGTLVAIPVYLALLQLPYPYWPAVSITIMGLLGIGICGRAAAALRVHDHPGIVWDEIVGYLITLSAVQFSWVNVIAGFLLFRLFDIVKPWPVSWLDRNVKGGAGIMLDDVAAGVFAGMVLWSFNYFL